MDLVEFRNTFMFEKFYPDHPRSPKGQIGIPLSLSTWEFFPLYANWVCRLGYEPILPDFSREGQRRRLAAICYPCEIFHGNVQNLIHKKGALAAARKGDSVNPEQASNGSQFYLVQGRVLTVEEINFLKQRGVANISEESADIYTTLGGTPHLDGAYTVFGEVVKGLEVIDSFANCPTDAYDRPVEDVIYSISLSK